MSGRAFRALELDYKLSSQCKEEWNPIQVGYLLSFSKDVLHKSLCLTLPHRHLLLHGPPGTGKTLFARTLARQSGAHLRINGYQWISMDTNPCRVPFFFVFYAQAWTMPSCPVEMWDLWAKMPCPGLTLGEWMRCDAMMNCAKSTHGRHYAYIRGPLYFAASFPV